MFLLGQTDGGSIQLLVFLNPGTSLSSIPSLDIRKLRMHTKTEICLRVQTI